MHVVILRWIGAGFPPSPPASLGRPWWTAFLFGEAPVTRASGVGRSLFGGVAIAPVFCDKKDGAKYAELQRATDVTRMRDPREWF